MSLGFTQAFPEEFSEGLGRFSSSIHESCGLDTAGRPYRPCVEARIRPADGRNHHRGLAISRLRGSRLHRFARVASEIWLALCDRKSLTEIARYGGVSFILMISYKLRFKTDEIVISTFLSVAAVTFFSNGDRLVDYTGEVVVGLAQLFIPMSGHSDAKGDMNQLRKIFVAGNRACALIVLPITATLVILGKSVITAWVGPRYVTASYPVMVILLLSFTCILFAGGLFTNPVWQARRKSLAWVTSYGRDCEHCAEYCADPALRHYRGRTRDGHPSNNAQRCFFYQGICVACLTSVSPPSSAKLILCRFCCACRRVQLCWRCGNGFLRAII